MNFLSNPKPSTTLDDAKPEQVGFSREGLDRLREAMAREIAAGRIPGAVVAIMRRGRLAFLESFGVRDPASQAPMPVDAVFSIASMTKAMTSVAALQLFEEGRLRWLIPWQRICPHWPTSTCSTPGRTATSRPSQPPARRRSKTCYAIPPDTATVSAVRRRDIRRIPGPRLMHRSSCPSLHSWRHWPKHHCCLNRAGPGNTGFQQTFSASWSRRSQQSRSV